MSEFSDFDPKSSGKSNYDYSDILRCFLSPGYSADAERIFVI